MKMRIVNLIDGNRHRLTQSNIRFKSTGVSSIIRPFEAYIIKQGLTKKQGGSQNA